MGNQFCVGLNAEERIRGVLVCDLAAEAAAECSGLIDVTGTHASPEC
jgi:hypothetical protein